MWSISSKDSYANWDYIYKPENSRWYMVNILTVNVMTLLLSIMNKWYIDKYSRT